MKIVSGGQTGVDRAALDIAIALDFPYLYEARFRKEDGQKICQTIDILYR